MLSRSGKTRHGVAQATRAKGTTPRSDTPFAMTSEQYVSRQMEFSLPLFEYCECYPPCPADLVRVLMRQRKQERHKKELSAMEIEELARSVTNYKYVLCDQI